MTSPEPSRLAATALQHDGSTGTGTVVLDDGRVLPYDAMAFGRSGLRLLRAGQRVVVELAPSSDATGTQAPRVVGLRIPTLG